MVWLTQLNLPQFLLFLLVLTRTSGIVITVPVFGGSAIPMQIRVLLAFTLALLVVPSQLSAAPPEAQSLATVLIVMVGELVIGLVLGLGVQIFFSGFQLAGQIISQMSGMSLAEVLSPDSDDSIPLLSNVLYLFALAIFVTVGGHRLLMSSLLDTFAAIPPGQARLAGTLVESLQLLVTQSFSLGIRAAAPATVALLLATVILALVTRTMPQLNVLSFGFGLSALSLFGALSLSLGAMAWLVEQQFDGVIETVLKGLGVS